MTCHIVVTINNYLCVQGVYTHELLTVSDWHVKGGSPLYEKYVIYLNGELVPWSQATFHECSTASATGR